MEMKISFKNMDPSDALKVFTNEKSERLAKYFQGRIIVNWTFSREHERRVAHCHLIGNNMDYFGQAEADDMHAAVDIALERIETQLRRHKEVVTNHLHRRQA